MPNLIETDHKPKWTLLISGSDLQLRQRQAEELRSHARELGERGIIVVMVSSSDATVLHGDCRCLATANDFADAYRLSFDRFSSSLIGEDDCVKWAAPTPVCFTDLMTVIDEMPHREAENATRGPASSFR